MLWMHRNDSRRRNETWHDLKSTVFCPLEFKIAHSSRNGQCVDKLKSLWKWDEDYIFNECECLAFIIHILFPASSFEEICLILYWGSLLLFHAVDKILYINMTINLVYYNYEFSKVVGSQNVTNQKPVSFCVHVKKLISVKYLSASWVGMNHLCASCQAQHELYQSQT